VDRIQQKSKEQVQSNADRKVKNHEKSEMKDYRIYTTEAVKIHRTVRVSIDNSISAQRRGTRPECTTNRSRELEDRTISYSRKLLGP
jgi:hypothetical protein